MTIKELLNQDYQKGYRDGLKQAIKIVEETVWKDAEMLVEYLKEELKGDTKDLKTIVGSSK